MRAKGEPMSDWLVVELSVGLVGFTLLWDDFWLKKVIGWFLVKINLVQALFIKAPNFKSSKLLTNIPFFMFKILGHWRNKLVT